MLQEAKSSLKQSPAETLDSLALHTRLTGMPEGT